MLYKYCKILLCKFRYNVIYDWFLSSSQAPLLNKQRKNFWWSREEKMEESWELGIKIVENAISGRGELDI